MKALSVTPRRERAAGGEGDTPGPPPPPPPQRHGPAPAPRTEVDPADVPMPRTIAPGVIEIDTLLGGWERVTAGYLMEGPAPVLVEAGSQSSVPVVLDALAGLGVGPGELAGVVVTHIHLDHAGGVG